MTTFKQFHDRNRDMQDGIERHIWGEQEFTDAGAIMKVRGTDTEDEEVPVINTAVGMHLPKDTNTEVFLLAGGSDMGQKFAIPTIPRDKQRRWIEGTNGIQFVTDGSRGLEFNSKRSYVDDPNFATRNGVLEVQGNTVYIRGNLTVSGTLSVGGTLRVAGNIVGPIPSGSATVTVPGFDR
jgi:hypothetical protein